jgi:hypothetical protein
VIVIHRFHSALICVILIVFAHASFATAAETCPKGCTCLSEAQAEKEGYLPCGGQLTLCGYDKAQNPLYCYQPPQISTKTPTPTETPTPTPTQTPALQDCPGACVCLPPDQANQLGYGICGGKPAVCAYDQYQNPMYCYEQPPATTETPAPDQCPAACSCMDPATAKNSGYESCTGEDLLCGYGSNQNPLYCYQPASTPTQTPTPTVTATATPKKLESNPPSISVEESPYRFFTDGRVRYSVDAYDPSGIAVIEIWMNDERARVCYADSCDFVSPPSEDQPIFGAIAVDRYGNFQETGSVPAAATERLAAFGRDADGDGVSDLWDNCVDVENPDQNDHDGDGIGDLCDACSVNGNLIYDSEQYCCDRCYTPCRDRVSRWDAFFGDVFYWEEFYDRVTSNGCGCYDSDGGRNYFVQGQISTEEFEIETGHAWTSPAPGVPSRVGRSASSTSVSGPEDYCSPSGNLIEFTCGEDGVEQEEVTCPYGCSDGACTCPDTDGGRDYYTAGSVGGYNDYCDWGNVVERYCGWDEETGFRVMTEYYRCPHGCTRGACILCEDTDGGVDYYRRGTAAGHEDTCLNGVTLQEYFVRPGEGTCEVYAINITCLGGCSDGACTATCADGLQNQDETAIDCGGSCSASCTDCFADAAFGSGPESDLFSLGNSAVERAAAEALMEYADCLQDDACRSGLPTVAVLTDYSSVTAADLETSTDSIMEAVGYYVDQHMEYVYDDLWGSGAPNIQSARYTIVDSHSRCSMDYCGDCEDHAILRHSLMRTLGISSHCAYLADYMEGYWGTGGHTFNIVNYRNKYRIMDYGPLGHYFNNRWSAHVPHSLWNDRTGEYWCADWKDNVAGPGGCDKVRPSRYTWNYAGGDSCPASWSGEETYHPDVCP